LKIAGKEDWPVAHTGLTLVTLFKAIPFKAEVGLLTELKEALLSLNASLEQETKGQDATTFAQMPQWIKMLRIRKAKVIGGEFREFDEELDALFWRMRSIDIRQAEETMQRGVSERDNPSNGFKRKETACLTMVSKEMKNSQRTRCGN
jgi:FAD/FMN-containing dehydrogenase